MLLTVLCGSPSSTPNRLNTNDGLSAANADVDKRRNIKIIVNMKAKVVKIIMNP
jgi:hypothetical protein